MGTSTLLDTTDWKEAAFTAFSFRYPSHFNMWNGSEGIGYRFTEPGFIPYGDEWAASAAKHHYFNLWNFPLTKPSPTSTLLADFLPASAPEVFDDILNQLLNPSNAADSSDGSSSIHDGGYVIAEDVEINWFEGKKLIHGYRDPTGAHVSSTAYLLQSKDGYYKAVFLLEFLPISLGTFSDTILSTLSMR